MRLPTGGGVAQGELDAMQLEIDQTGAGPLVAAPPAGSVAAEAYGWFCLGDWGNRANSFVPFAGHQAGSNGIVGLTDSSVLFVENIANHELGQYISYAAPATLSGPVSGASRLDVCLLL